MGEIWSRADEIPWKHSKFQYDLYPPIYYFIYDHNPYNSHDITADPSPWGLKPF
jgi:hypothetical protein